MDITLYRPTQKDAKPRDLSQLAKYDVVRGRYKTPEELAQQDKRFEKTLQNPKMKFRHAVARHDAVALSNFSIPGLGEVSLLKPSRINILRGLFQFSVPTIAQKPDMPLKEVRELAIDGWKWPRHILKDSGSSDQPANLRYNYLSPFISLGLIEDIKRGKNAFYRLTQDQDTYFLFEGLLQTYQDFNLLMEFYQSDYVKKVLELDEPLKFNLQQIEIIRLLCSRELLQSQLIDIERQLSEVHKEAIEIAKTLPRR